ncbi:MAG: UDP-N-acetylmuramate--L-alanine ligase [Heliobacteriaceae bacterium]|nr:UDP-N-acetylmuramate--L-alanine ligase [Heliobacteriaceae bacterium]MDD4588076.1 UDP-N-acetylmuramate--L-alanine ligase [Heliobacteriaceae bacterium]
MHFIGIGGIGMSGLARVLLALGHRVSGSDLADTPLTRQLAALGATVYTGHQEANVAPGVDTVVVSTAVRGTNPELLLARERGLLIKHRADLLAELMLKKKGIAVAGAHGKTTTSAMIGVILEQAGWDPAIIVGGEIREIAANAKWGQGEFLVAEADESDGSFLKLQPQMAIITNIEGDHLDYYRSVQSIEEAFDQFAQRVPTGGSLVLCSDDPKLRVMAEKITGRKVITYGLYHPADYVAANVAPLPEGSRFDVITGGRLLGQAGLTVPGAHNIANALAALACADQLGVPFSEAASALQGFHGVGRRFQLRGEAQGVRVIDDYAHHPTEVRATLAAARQVRPQRLIAVFQPHRYTRTQALYQEFGAALTAADIVVINDIYSAGEPAIPGVSAGLIVEAIKGHNHGQVCYIPDKEKIVDYLVNLVRPGDLVLTMGAGNIWTVGAQLAGHLAKR